MGRPAKGRSDGSTDARVTLDPAALATALDQASSQSGESLAALAERQPRLVLFLRHLGCIFCREALADLAKRREQIESSGAGIVLVHLARDDQRAERLFTIYKLADVPRIADPERALYQALGLGRGSVGDLLGPRVLVRAVDATCHGHRQGRSGGDTRQMPGVFLIHHGRVLAEFRHRTAADRPDFLALTAHVPAPATR